MDVSLLFDKFNLDIYNKIDGVGIIVRFFDSSENVES